MSTHTRPASPASKLSELLGARGLSQSAFARDLGVTRPYLNGLLNEKYPFNQAIALKLEAALGIPAAEWMERVKEWDRFQKSPEGRILKAEEGKTALVAEFAMRGRGYLLGYEVSRAVADGLIDTSGFSEDQLSAEGLYLTRASSLERGAALQDLRKIPAELPRGARAVVFSEEEFRLGPHIRAEFAGLAENLQGAFVMTSHAQALPQATRIRLALPLFNAGEDAVFFESGTDLGFVRFYFDPETP